ncbi:MAG: enoyl-CoA hydratase-related protein [Candidatus Nanopelagicales bacterium]|nr:enoyl-CoA hydratase-related protein [Candidatus Nanopelagicales bacterium]
MRDDDRPEDTGIRASRGDGVLTLIIDRPELRNALTDEVLAALVLATTEADADTSIRCIVIQGSDTVFASGADIRVLLARTPGQMYCGERTHMWSQLRAVRTPMVAAVSGLCLGGGTELAMMCDLIVASSTARFGLPETQLGLIPGSGGTQLLPRAIGKAKAMDMILTGRLLDASEADRYGLVSRVVDPESWRQVAADLAAAIAARSAVAQRLTKVAVKAAFESGFSAGLETERAAFGMAAASADSREGLQAFVDKRTPEWKHE